MRTIKLTIAYDGTNYRGWQLQENGNTIQEEIEKALFKVFKKRSRVNGASRTDSGVHAEAQAAHFRFSSAIPSGNVAAALNSVLPEDIAVIKAEEVPDGFNSRFDARLKKYRYQILNSRTRDPFLERYSWRVPYNLNPSLMRKEALVLKGRHDFRSFQAKDKRERSSVRTIKNIVIKKTGLYLTINIEGDGFLYNMVRNIAGTLVDIGRGYLPPGSMRKILDSRDRRKAGPTAPAKGLFLVGVEY
ncbi:MAG: tRNA pseudouridine(38-40) synthase TruA [Candidatus Omnitrophota bacterium]